MTRLYLIISILFILLMCQPFPAMSETIEGSVRTDFFSSSRSLDEETDLVDMSLQMKASPRWNSIKGYGEAWFRADDIIGKDNYRVYLREAYLGWDGADGSIRLGRQRIIWGRADQVNPTDNLTPRDYTLRVPETDDQRQGAYAMKGDYFWRDLTITGIIIPVFKPSKIPLDFPATVSAGEEIPDTNLSNTSWALKLDSSGGKVDFSISYFYGLDLLPDARLNSVDDKIHLILLHHRIRVIGADFATTLGPYGLRGEAAYFITDDTDGSDPFIKNPYFFYVLGLDRNLSETLNINIQWIQRIIFHFKDPEAIADPIVREVAEKNALFSYQQRPQHNSLSLRLSQKWFHETLEGEVLLVYNITGDDYLFRPKLIYAITDHTKITLGGDIYDGSTKTPFGRLKENNGWYVELKYSF